MSDEGAVSVATLREAVRQAAVQTSMSKVAAEIGGITDSAVRNFIRKGTQPRAQTLRKLRQWYARWVRASAVQQAMAAETALLTLLDFVPDGEPRTEARVAVLEALRGTCGAHGVLSPPLERLWRTVER